MRPISCEGGNFDLIKIPLVTLIDTLDTLVIVQDIEEFRRAVAVIVERLPRGFDFDVNVSVFETTIRLLGGLLSAHLFAIDPQLQIYPVGFHLLFIYESVIVNITFLIELVFSCSCTDLEYLSTLTRQNLQDYLIVTNYLIFLYYRGIVWSIVMSY